MRNYFNNKDLDKVEKIAYFLCGILIFFLLMSPILFTRPAICGWFDFTNTGSIGDTIGGLTSPFVGLIGAILVFISFRQQVKANRNLKDSEDKKYYFELFQQINDTIGDELFKFTIPRAKIDRRNLLKYILSVKTKKKIETEKIKNYQNITYSIKEFAFCISAYLTLKEKWSAESQFTKILEIKLRHYRNNLKLKSIELHLRKVLILNADFLVRHLNSDDKKKMINILANREELDKYIAKNEKSNSTSVNLKYIKKIRSNFVYSFIQDLEQFDKL